MYVLKFPVTLALTVCFTLGTIYLMQWLIETGESAIDEDAAGYLVEFVRLKEEPELQLKRRQKKPPPDPDEPPPPMQQEVNVAAINDGYRSVFKAPVVDTNLRGLNAFHSDGEYLPIIKVQSVYPRQALQKGLFGWVLVEFTVDTKGQVLDPVIIDTCVETYQKGGVTECVDSPGKMFNGPTLVAVRKYKYKPRVIDGVPIETRGVQNRVYFTLSEMR